MRIETMCGIISLLEGLAEEVGEQVVESFSSSDQVKDLIHQIDQGCIDTLEFLQEKRPEDATVGILILAKALALILSRGVEIQLARCAGVSDEDPGEEDGVVEPVSEDTAG